MAVSGIAKRYQRLRLRLDLVHSRIIGKYVCGLARATQHPNCVVSSMGVETKSSFEQEVLTQSRDCQVYGPPRTFPVAQRVNDASFRVRLLRLGMGARAARGQQSQRARPFLSVQDWCGRSARCGSEGVLLAGS
jgi:hypothetical protein